MEKDNDQIVVDFIEANPDVAQRISVENVKNRLIDLIWKQKVEKALQSITLQNTETEKKLIINLYAASNIDDTNFPQNIDEVGIEYRQVGPTQLLKKNQ